MIDYEKQRGPIIENGDWADKIALKILDAITANAAEPIQHLADRIRLIYQLGKENREPGRIFGV